MLKKIVSIKNVGRFRNSAAAGNPQLGKYTFILGANGFGKTTICSVLRSFQTGDADLLKGRKTLGATGEVTVELLLDAGPAFFNGTKWTSTTEKLAIFDGTFIAQNVYSGEAVEIDHKRNLYRVIIGEDGVSLAEEDTKLAADSRGKSGEISAAEKAIKLHVPAGMTLEQFLALPPNQDIDTKITEQERTVEAVRQGSDIYSRSGVSEITLPDFPITFGPLLARTIENIADDVEKRIADHLASHNMTDTGESWISEGIEHADGDTCPFCGQSVTGLPLIAAYRAFFGDAYKALKGDIESTKENIAKIFGEGAIGKLTTLIAQNRAAAEFWQRYCAFDAALLAPPESLTDAIRRLGAGAQTLLTSKAGSPLEALKPAVDFEVEKNIYLGLQESVATINTAIRAANDVIASKKTATSAENLKTAQAELDRLKAIKKRHEIAVAQVCAEHVRLTGEKNNIEGKKEAIREKLAAHTKKVVKPYEKRINKFLDSFNAGFRIDETKHAYPGGVATSSYRLVINRIAVDLGDARTPHDRPSFKNTLSAGDRTTLALAFFLAHLERDAGKAQKIVVFDDPFTSQDAFRRRQTVHEIKRVGRECAQVLVLSHDVTLLKQVWEKSPASERIALQINDARSLGSKLLVLDIDRACQGRVASEIDDLMTYDTTGAGKPLDLIKKMRVVLETYCRTTYQAYFDATDWLGDIVRKIRDGADDHPAKSLYDELDQINDYTTTYHHGEDVGDATPENIDPDELTGFVRRTLKIVNALQA
jgi:wobble nucleotide-excising tRNase